MSTDNHYVIDTTSLISYYKDIFGCSSAISATAIKIIKHAFVHSTIRLTIPSIVFVELFEKWNKTEEMQKKIYYEIYYPIKCADNIDIRNIDSEVLENFISIDDRVINLENHDKLVLASAITLEAKIITNDPKIIRYVKKTHCIPGFIL